MSGEPIESRKILATAITSEMIATNNIEAPVILPGMITADKIRCNAITISKVTRGKETP